MSNFDEGIGPMFIPRRVAPDDSRAAQARDPYLAALQARYAQQMADAQNVVQGALQGPNANPFMWDAATMMAAQKRRQMAIKAAQEFNAGIGTAGNPGDLKDTMRWDF